MTDLVTSPCQGAADLGSTEPANTCPGHTTTGTSQTCDPEKSKQTNKRLNKGIDCHGEDKM